MMMKKALITLLLFELLGSAGVAVAQVPSLPVYGEKALLDSITSQHGIMVSIPSGYSLNVLEDWVNFCAFKDGGGSSSISLYNGVIKGKDLVVVIRPLGPDSFPRHSFKRDAFLASDLDYVNGHKYPDDFESSDYIRSLPDESARRLFGADWVKFLPIRPASMLFSYYDREGEPELQKLMETAYPNVRIFYFGKESFPRFDVIVLWRDLGKRSEDKVLRQLKRIIQYQ